MSICRCVALVALSITTRHHYLHSTTKDLWGVRQADSGRKSVTNGSILYPVRGSYKEDFVKVSEYGSAVFDAAKKDADAIKAALEAETLIICKGLLKDNTGKVVIPKGKGFKQKDNELEKMD